MSIKDSHKIKLKQEEDYFHYTGPVSGSESNSNSSSRNNSKKSSNGTTPILKSKTIPDETINNNKIEFLPCEKVRSTDTGLCKYGISYSKEKLFGNFVVNKNGSFQLPKSPMPKNVLNNVDDESEEEEEEDEEDDERTTVEEDDDDDEDEDDEDDDIENSIYDEENLLRTESTKSLAKVNPLLFNTEFPHKAPIEENFKLGCRQEIKETEIKHAHLPRTPFPKNHNIPRSNISSIEASNIINTDPTEIHLNLTSSSMLNRRRASSIAQSPTISILKSTK
ncbi:hypothetical protein ACO0SA_001200 [Hanseniaspora valbyensis]